ncbi:YdgA family protein [Xenorhabdus hominickii]|uniref:GTP-binding protein YdgA n=1 Tax=Xenorhabdus hominickii TaxID=351679 RepID=A0A2G0Q4X4_XENHO|nr:YdgA family protein [Xenorhabdus hominickii]AOM40083.1 hypothetical protein A9255_05535 [Xenorhabdus hominickii]PHM54280.1 hypothetical protein Xhom_03357 [Xenorhabdus hominickii]
MKKSLVAVSVIVALGAAWTGASWYTGKQIESRIDQILEKANAKLAGTGGELQKKEFKRGIFSSDALLVLSHKNNKEEKNKEKNEDIVFKSRIDHGPFPLADIAKFKLAPKLASIHTELEKNDVTEKLFEITKSKSLFGVDSRIGYDQSLYFDINIIPVEYKDEATGDNLSFSGATITVDTDNKFNKFSSTVKSNEVKIDFKKNESIELKNIDFSMDTKKNKFDTYLGNSNFNIGEIKLTGLDDNDLSIQDVKTASVVGEDNENNINNTVSFSIDGLKIKDIDFGSSKFVFSLNNLDGLAYSKFNQAYYDSIIQAIKSGDFESHDKLANAAMLEYLPTMLKHNAQFSIKPLSAKNSKGESAINFNVTLNNFPEDLNSLMLGDSEDIIRKIIKNLSLDIKLSKPMIVESIALSQQLKGKDKSAAETEGKQQVQMMAAQGTALKLFTDTEDTIGLNFHYDNDKVKLNDKESSLHQFLLDNGLVGSYDDVDGEQNQHNEAELPVAE